MTIRIAETIMSAKDNFQARIIFICQQNQLGRFVFSQIILPRVVLSKQAFQIRIVLLVGIIIRLPSTPIEFLNDTYIVFMVLVEIVV